MSGTPFRGTGALVNVITVDRENVADFENWYAFEHFLDRVDLPGFIRGRRYVGADVGETKSVPVFSIYETETVDTLTGETYLAALDRPTPWTKRAFPYFTSNVRSVCRLVASVGVGTSATIVVVELRPDSDEVEPTIVHLEAILDGLVSQYRILAGSVLVLDPVATSAKDSTAEGRVAAASAGELAPAVPPARWYVVLDVHASLDIARAAADLEHVLDVGPWAVRSATLYTLVSERLSA